MEIFIEYIIDSLFGIFVSVIDFILLTLIYLYMVFQYTTDLLVTIFFGVGEWTSLVISYVDVSLFQNVILGILTIFIPFVIVFFQDVLKTSDDTIHVRKEILLKEVFQAKKVFIISVAGLFVFSIKEDTDNLFLKSFCILIFALMIVFFWRAFQKILDFSKGNYLDSTKNYFLELYKDQTIFSSSNDTNRESELVESWKSFWSSPVDTLEEEEKLTKVFISHVDKAIENSNFNLAGNILFDYMNTLDKKRFWRVFVHQMFPNVLEWSYIPWSKNVYEIEGAEVHPGGDIYFSRVFFPKILKHSLELQKEDSVSFSSVVYEFEKHINKYFEILELLDDEKQKLKLKNYLRFTMDSFCSIYFDHMQHTTVSDGSLVNQDFPNAWKLTMEDDMNIEIAKMVLDAFIPWAEKKISKERYGGKFDDTISDVLDSIFPNADVNAFPIFLRLYFLNQVDDILGANYNFAVMGNITTYSESPPNENTEDRDKRNKQDILDALDKSLEDTIKMIITFFCNLVSHKNYPQRKHFHWKLLNTPNKEAVNNCDQLNKNRTVKEIMVQKLTDEKNKWESNPKILKLCKNDESKERRRREIVRFLGGLIRGIEDNQ